MDPISQNILYLLSFLTHSIQAFLKDVSTGQMWLFCCNLLYCMYILRKEVFNALEFSI